LFRGRLACWTFCPGMCSVTVDYPIASLDFVIWHACNLAMS